MTNMFIECMALELADKKIRLIIIAHILLLIALMFIRINGVAPTVVETTFRAGDPKKGLTALENQTYLESFATIKPLKIESKVIFIIK